MNETIKIEEYKRLFLGRGAGVRVARALFDYYVDVCDVRNCTRRRKDELATVLNVSARTVANYIQTLKDLNLIKRKFDGRTVINPVYYFIGNAEELETAKKVYTEFISDDIQKKEGIKNGKTGTKELKTVQEST